MPAGRELSYPGVANVIGNALRELNLEDVEPRPTAPRRAARAGRVQDVRRARRADHRNLARRGGLGDVRSERRRGPGGAVRGADGRTTGGGAAPAPGAEPDAASPAAAEAASAPADAVNTATHADPVAEAAAINQRVAGWRYKIAGFQYDQMTRRMADLLKPVG